MKILAHRGFWRDPSEKNTRIAFERALAKGFGIETDVRDLDGGIVISHDPPFRGAMSFQEFSGLCCKSRGDSTIAINIKSSGLQNLIIKELDQLSQTSFVFDMSVPDSIGYLKSGIRFFTRRSEYEFGGPLDSYASGIWLDRFDQDLSGEELANVLNGGKDICIVSPELHGRDHLASWSIWKDVLSRFGKNIGELMLCTDFPEEAAQHFGSSK